MAPSKLKGSADGKFYQPVKETAPCETRTPIKQQDNLTPSKDKFYEKPVEQVGPGEKRNPIRPNLRPEGEFYLPIKEPAPLKGNRMPTKRPEDQITVSTDAFYQRTVEDVDLTGERRSPIKQHDSLTPSKDKLYERPVETVGPGEKGQPISPQENLRPEGELYQREEPSDELLYNPALLTELKLSDKPDVRFDPPITISAPGDGLITRPLKRLDYTRGFLKILSQLTVVGDISEEQFLETFATMKSRPGTYYVTVIEDQNTGEVIGAATLLIEQKFVHQCARRARIEDVVVSDAYRGKQLGKLLIATLTLLGKHLDSYKITLDCNDRMTPFYQSLGFIAEPGNSNTLAIRY